MSEKADDSPNAARLAWVRDVLAQTRWSAGRLADEAGIARTTISRALKDPAKFGGFHDGTLRKIAAAAGVPVPPGILSRPPAGNGDPAPLNEDDLVACMEVIEEWLESRHRKASPAAKSKAIAYGLWPTVAELRAAEPGLSIDEMKARIRDKVDVAMRMASAP